MSDIIAVMENEKEQNTLIQKYDLLFGSGFNQWIGFKPRPGDIIYPCYACKHMFSTLQSLQDHVNRRTILLKYKCTNCRNQMFTFFNRCSLLLHARTHFKFGKNDINLAQVEMSPLPIHLVGFLPHPSIPLLYDERDEILLGGNEELSTQFYIPYSNNKNNQIVGMKGTTALFKVEDTSLVLRQVCMNVPKCIFVSLKQLQMMKSKQNNQLEVNVEIKQENVPQLTMPIISDVVSLSDAVCSECNTPNECFPTHFKGSNEPVNDHLACEKCKFISPTECSFKAHMRCHNKKPPYVCPECGTRFANWELLSHHINSECFYSMKHVRYRCPARKCGKLFATFSMFKTHFTNHLQSFYDCQHCKQYLLKSESFDAHLEHGDKVIIRYKCVLCPDIEPLYASNCEDHVLSDLTIPDRRLYVYLCSICKHSFRSTITLVNHIPRCPGKRFKTRKHPDKNKYIKENDKIGNKPNIIKQYICILCRKTVHVNARSRHVCKYARPLVLLKKLSLEKLKNLSIKQTKSSNIINTSIKRKRLNDNEDSTKKRRIRSNIKKSIMEDDPVAEDPINFDGTYHCKLCSYETTIRNNFHSHVKTHRDVSIAYQCMECGECFVVKPSFIKHLLHFHKISDSESYMKENDCYDVAAVKELEEIMHLAPGESKGPVKENQCRVCLQEFKDALALSKHFRIHGMAFLLKNSK